MVIGPVVWKVTSNGVAHPFSASAGVESNSSGKIASAAATPGLVDSRSESRTHGFSPPARQSCQRSTFVPSSASPAGIANRPTPTASTQATITPKVADSSSAPGAIISAPSMPTASAVPAKITVRPARATASLIASSTLAPPRSSSRNRDTISRE